MGTDQHHPQARVERAEAAIHKMSCANKAQLRLPVAHSLTREKMDNHDGKDGRDYGKLMDDFLQPVGVRTAV